MQISETFFSVQGEGRTAGYPAFFIRFAGCGKFPPCPWCDTKYAIKTKDSTSYDTNQMVNLIKEWWRSGYPRNIVFTGGEPLMQSGPVEDISRELDKSSLPPFKIIETNSEHFHPFFLQVPKMHIVLSPKLAGGMNFKEKTIKQWIRAWNKLKKEERCQATVELKLVVSSSEDLDRAGYLLDEILLGEFSSADDFHNFPITLQPLAPTPFDLDTYLLDWRNIVLLTQKNYYWSQFNLQVIPQQHKMLFGDKRRT